MDRATLEQQIWGTGPWLAELDPALVDALADIVEEAEKPFEAKEAPVASWFYFVPCAGVRYYAFEEHPSPVEPARCPH